MRDLHSCLCVITLISEIVYYIQGVSVEFLDHAEWYETQAGMSQTNNSNNGNTSIAV